MPWLHPLRGSIPTNQQNVGIDNPFNNTNIVIYVLKDANCASNKPAV